MKKLFFAAAVAAIALSSCGGGGSASLRSEADSVSYIIGTELGGMAKNFDSTMNVNIMAAAIKDVFNNAPKMTQDEMNAFMREYQTVRVPAKAKKASDEFIASIEKSNKKAVKTPSGLIYEIIEPGDQNVKPTAADQVRVLYTGTLKNGKEFDSTTKTDYEGNVKVDTAQFAIAGTIPGFTEGLQLVGKGGKIKLWIPADLGYGPNGNYSIGPNEALVFEVDLIDVVPAAPEAPATGK